MDFRILGPLEVDDRGHRLPLRGRRQRALLASLLLRAGEIVPEETLLEEVWRGEPPPSGGAALRVRISQLRKALASAESPPALATRAPGYVLEVDAGQVDALRFERLLGEGRAQLAGGDPTGAAKTLREALELWRGPALAEFADDPFAAAESARLEELRIEAVEERVEAELALGRHRELAAELDALAAEHPFRERLRAQLMLALYRSGRQAEALAAYRDARGVYVEELGIEPTRRLQELEQAILRQDASLDAPRGEGSSEQRSPSLPAGERKLATILVAAPAGQPEERDPERSSALLERFRDAAVAELESCGGHVQSFAGDTLTAAFGVPVAQEDHTPRALHAALRLRRRIEEEFGSALPLRIGIETGEVLSGGRSGVAGIAVVEAARLQHAAEPGAIVVGDRAAATARHAFEFGPPRQASAGECSGRPLLRALTVTEPGGHRPFVGRAAELVSLRSAYRRVVDEGGPRLVTVAGAAGVGKTRLVRELWQELAAASPEPLRRTGRCPAFGAGTTYRPVADVVREQLGLLATDPSETVTARLGRHASLGLVLGQEPDADVHPLTAREALHAGCVSFLSELAAGQPAVVLVEDLHWAHEPLLDLLERALDEVSGPLLLVCTARPELLEHHPAWGRRRNAETLWVEPLTNTEARVLLDDLCGDEISESVRSLLVERADGNPFFLEELHASLPEREASATAPQIPDTVHAVLAARIDQLAPNEKAALQAAAVIGRIFWQAPVCELLEGNEPDFSLLEARDFVRRRLGSALADERELIFRHALTREVAYAGLPKARRARLHAAFAAWLERLGDGRGEHAALLAHHYAEAARPEDADLAWVGEDTELEQLRAKAVTWLGRAAELAIGRYELDEALAMLQRALELEPPPLAQLSLWRAIGKANALRHDGDPFLSAMTKAIELAPDRATAGELYAELSFEAALRAGMWRRRPDRDLVDGWIDRALELAGPETPARARALIARCVWAPLGSAEAAREAGVLAERLGDPELRSYAWDARAITLWVSGEQDLGRALEERRFELIDQIHDPDHKADIHYAPVSGCIWLGYFDEARRLARRHDEITSTLTPHHRIHGVAVLVEVEELAGAWESIRALEGRAEETILGNLETPCARSPRSLLVCALAAAHLGDHARAAQLEAAAEEFRMEGYGHVLDTPRLRLALLRDDLERAAEIVADPLPDRGWHRAWLLLSTLSARIDALARLGHREELEAWDAPRPGTYLEPFHLRALGIVREDEELLARALAAFEALRLGRQAAETRAMLV